MQSYELVNIPNVPLANKHTSVVDRLRQAALEDLSLETALQEVLDLEREHVIETHASLVEHADADETTDEGVALEETLGVLVIELEEFTSSTTNLGEGETDTPDLTLVTETILASELELSIETSGLKWTTGDFVTV